ncbi:serine/threonine protein kinase [Saccharibacillus alkalitolerans]|uniref:non-specific serine/threonine protein kinase n=1 Tax=Saccharibacillus alkalitolerans TaxID=2705290 RepID=A0ABX0F4E3_9BACL|nr:serine/threonine-protein kinase [Saccharibacillus alkalitolerans]NGZ74493.1 serine/threonine protein kinase [Saccharibacillus alkalitolerans]
MPYPPQLERGAVIGERYRVERVLGSGGMGRVYLASDAKLPGKWWAVKETMADTADYERIENEARMLTRLRHRSLPQVADFFAPDAEGRVFLVMEYIEGSNLGEYMAHTEGRPSIPFVLELALRICEVLEYLHGQSPPIVFRDLKPGNVMIGGDGTVRLIDFGIARSAAPEKNADTVKLGTIGFAAPEQYEGRSDPSSDQYALGALLLYLCTGGAFSEWTPDAQRALRPDMPPTLVPAIRRMLSYRREERFESVAEVKRLIRPDGTDEEHAASAGSSGGGTTTVAVLGNYPGCGSTHTAIAAAHTLAREGGRTALVELGRASGTFERIAMEWEGEPLKGKRTFSIRDVDYWPAADRERLGDIFGRGYRHIVLDLGTCGNARDFEEFLRADIPLIVGSASEWRSGDLIAFAHRESLRARPKWIYALPFAADNAVKDMRRRLGHKKVYALPALPDPFGGNAREAFEPILGALYGRQARRSFMKLGFR